MPVCVEMCFNLVIQYNSACLNFLVLWDSAGRACLYLHIDFLAVINAVYMRAETTAVWLYVDRKHEIKYVYLYMKKKYENYSKRESIYLYTTINGGKHITTKLGVSCALYIQHDKRNAHGTACMLIRHVLQHTRLSVYRFV